MLKHKQALLMSPMISWGGALLLVVLFVLVLWFSPRRRFVSTWIGAWGAMLASTSVLALDSYCWLQGIDTPGAWMVGLSHLSFVGDTFFLAFVTLGSLEIAGRVPTARSTGVVLAIALAAGLAISFIPNWRITQPVYLIAVPVIYFGCVQQVLAHADRSRRVGTLVFAFALALHGTLGTLFLIDNRSLVPKSAIASVAHDLRFAQPLVTALTLGVLGAAVILVLMQDANIETSRVRESQLREVTAARRRLDGIIHAATEAIVTVDGTGSVEFLNGAAEALFGVDTLSVRGTPIDSLLTAGNRSVQELLARHPAGGNSTAGAREPHVGAGRRRDGTGFPAEFAFAPLGDESLAGGAVVIVRDLTPRLELEAQREMYEERLAQSQKMLAVNRVASSLAREIESPLAAIVARIEVLLADPGQMREDSWLAEIRDHSNKARHVLRDLQASVQQVANGNETLDLSLLTRSVAVAMAAQAMRADVTLTTDLADHTLSVRGDQVRVAQVIAGLVENAIGLAGRGGTVRVATRLGGARGELLVEDSGPGIVDELVPHLFGSALQAKPDENGSSPNLFLSARLARALGGALRVENRPEPGIGSRFILSLPLV